MPNVIQPSTALMSAAQLAGVQVRTSAVALKLRAEERASEADHNRIIIRVEDDCMSPTLTRSDFAVIELSSAFPADSLYYIRDLSGDPVIRRLQQCGRDRVKIISDNTHYQPTCCAIAELVIVGRVRIIWKRHEF